MKKPQIKKKVHYKGVWGKCIACDQHLPLHPKLEMCGACTFGEADALMEFEGEWDEIEEIKRP